MSDSFNIESLKLPDEVSQGLSDLCQGYQTIYGDKLKALIVYGSVARGFYQPGESDVNLLVVLDNIDLATLDSVQDITALARKFAIAPLFMTPDDLDQFTTVFPIKFLAMKENYRVLMGEDVFTNRNVDDSYLSLRCRQETQNLLMRLRRHRMTRSGGLAGMMERNIGGFIETLRMLLRVKTGSVPARSELVTAAETAFGIDGNSLKQVMALRDEPHPNSEEAIESLYNNFMHIVQITLKGV